MGVVNPIVEIIQTVYVRGCRVEIEVPRERMRSLQSTINYSVEIPTWSTHTQCCRLSAGRAARVPGWPF